MTSILTSIKKLLGIEEAVTHFDDEIIMNINSVFVTLMQLGVGPEAGFSITDKTKTWTDFFGSGMVLESVKIYIYLKVRLTFDPPSSSFVLDSTNRQVEELGWRLTVQIDEGIPEEVEEEEV